jgi:hypothetical protein
MLNGSKGIVLLAQNSTHDYVKQACVLAMSIRATNDTNVCLLTDDKVPSRYLHLFDCIKPIPWNDDATDTEWKVNNRWKLYHASPYDETIVMDTDMLVLQNIDTWWDFLGNYEMFYVSKVYTYRGSVVNDTYYRKTFKANDLPNLYAGLHYFKKCDFAKEFYTWLELVMNNWQLFYGKYAPKQYQNWLSVDTSTAIVAKILDCEDKITNKKVSFPSFTHMKPKIQGWYNPSETWRSRVGSYLTDDLALKIGNHQQQGIFHYTEKEFLTDDKVAKYEKGIGI